MAIPFFILAGEIMGQGGISKRIIAFTNVLVGRVRGGLAQVNILASTFLAASLVRPSQMCLPLAQ